MPESNELYKTLLSRATGMKADPYAQWFSDHPILGALASLVSPAVDPHREMGPADLVYTGLPFAAATGGVAKAGSKMYKGIKSGPSTALDKYGLEDKMSRRGLFDRMVGNTNERAKRDLNHVEGALNHLEDKEWGTYDPDTNPYGWIEDPNEGPDAYGTRMYSPEEKKLLDKHSELYNIHEMIGEKLGWPGKTTILDRLKGELRLNDPVAEPGLEDGVPQAVTSTIDSLMRRFGVRK